MRFGCKQADDDSLLFIASRTRWSMAVSYMHSHYVTLSLPLASGSLGPWQSHIFLCKSSKKNRIATPVKATGLQWVVTFKLLFGYRGSMVKKYSSIKFGMLCCK